MSAARQARGAWSFGAALISATGCSAEVDPALEACTRMEGPTAAVVASATIAAAPSIELSVRAYDVALPATGVGFVRFHLASAGTVLIFTAGRREATRIHPPVPGPAGRALAAEDLCGLDPDGQALGFGGSDEYCRSSVRDHRYFDAYRPGSHVLRLRSASGRVRLWITDADGHRFEHVDEHAHRHSD